MLVAIDREHQTGDQVHLPCRFLVVENAERRSKNNFIGLVGRTSRVVLGNAGQIVESRRKRHALYTERLFRIAVVGERPHTDKTLDPGVA